MGLILDLAVVALALVVIGSLALLSWTLGVSAVRSVGRGREAVAEARRSATESEGRLTVAAGEARSRLQRLSRRTAPRPTTTLQTTPTPAPTQPPTTPSPPGEQPDA